MLTMSWSTFRDRWPVFIGAIITVAVGVALVQSSLLNLISAVSPTIPPGLSAAEETAIRDGLVAAIALLGTMVGMSVFVAFFIVGSTFSFTVTQRSRDFALLRLVGASPGQVGRLLLGEALLLGTLGTILGVLLSIPVLDFQVSMLTRMEFVPAGFIPEWRPWILAVSLGTGTGVAVIASLGASHRASRVRPMVALRDTGQVVQVMSLFRWFIGLVALAGAVTLQIVATQKGGNPLEALLPGLLVLIISLSALTPLVVPLIGGLIGLVSGPLLRWNPIHEFAHANLRDGVGRSASTAAPIVILVGLVIGFTGAADALNAGIQQETVLVLDGDLVVTTIEPVGEQLAALDGVRTVSEEVPLHVRVDSATKSAFTKVNAIAIDAVAYTETHRLNGIIGDLSGLHGETVALDQRYASGLNVQVGDTVKVRLEGIPRDLRVVATFPYTLSGPEVLLPVALATVGGHQRRYIIQTDETETPAVVSQKITSAVLGRSAGSGLSITVSALDDWIRQENDIQQQVGQNSTLVVLGLVTVYIVIAIINAVVIAASARRTEFAIARLTGLSRGQVVGAALWESLTVVAVGVIVGGFAAGVTVVGVNFAVSDIVGARIWSPPWALFGAATVGVVVVVGLTSVITTLAATRQPAVNVAGARE